ncbi:helix-hairpin-helix domain-containing protein [uncultured Acetatifactor sp.]|uniref:helix-hairpin-helix domain-containing protein n=1 Tax=uncultured Acetatifactor sp. TaxID=1671927 RepID=UPI002630D7CE|nr:helix-hairpin-helix domain-containing protein [uncultured Acetatifactor sp.]
MTQSEKIERIKYLVAALSEASKAYYAQDREIMSNREYDALYDELAVLERETGMVLANSPTMSVGYEAVDELPKERHESPMLSLDKTKSREELAEWLQGHPAVLSWKLDGLTIVLTYREGKLEKAVTRGNGEIGEVITNNARTFVNLPLEIPFRGELVLRGEAVISYSDFQKINDEIEDADARYKNPRNLCSGSVRQLNNEITARRNVRFYAFALVDAREADSGDADVGADSVEAQFRFLEEQGFETVEHYLVTEENILDTVERFEKKIETYDIPSDGLVLVYDDIVYGRSLGRTAKFPRNSIAFKWADELRETRLLEIEWSASRTGLINPVAIFEPVELEGTTVSRASVHNISILRGLHLGIGDRITVYKANMIIPQIAENLTARDLLAQAQAEDVRAGEEIRLAEEERPAEEGCPAGGEQPIGKEASAGEEPPTGKGTSVGEEQPVGKEAWEGEEQPTGKETPTGQELPADDEQVIEEEGTEVDAAEKAEAVEAALAMRGHRLVEIPSVCPVCGGATEIRRVNDVQSLYCTNVRCAAKQIKAFTLFVSRDAMNIDGLSEATLEKFIDMGFIQEFADLFHLDRYRERIVEMEGFGEKSYQNLIDSIERARRTTLPRVIYGLGIANIGSANAKMLCRFFDHDLKRMQEADVETLSAIDGVGEVIATAFVRYMRDEDNLRKIADLVGELEIEIPKVEEGSQTLSGLSFVITGSLEKFASRSDLKEAIEQKGGKVTGSVTGKTTCLINNDVASNSSKNKKAKELGIPILSEADFLAQYQVSGPGE